MADRAGAVGGAPRPGATRRPWTFLTNHGHVLLAVAADPDVRVADLARRTGITPRAALLILRDLEDAGYVHRQRVGRRTHYTVARHRPFRHPATAHHEVDELLAIFAADEPDGAGGPPVTPGAGPAPAPPDRGAAGRR